MRSLLFIAFISAVFAVSAFAQPEGFFPSRSEKYLDTMLAGWHVKVNQVLLDNNRTIAAQTMDFIASELRAVSASLPAEPVNFMKDIPIWLEQSTKNKEAIQYHRDVKWLKKNGYDPKKEGAIEITAVDFLNRKGKDTLVLLPMLAFGYSFRVLGGHNKTIQDAYESAKLAELYTLQDYIIKDNKRFRLRDAEQYFAVLTQAYFGTLNDMPHNRKELQIYDPKGYAMVEELWKVKK
jgi:hypothetical protein